MIQQSTTKNSTQFCQLAIRNQFRGNMYYDVIIKAGALVDVGVPCIVVDQMQTNMPENLHAFLARHGIPAVEINAAVDAMVHHDHNAAIIARDVGFLYSFTDEVVQ